MIQENKGEDNEEQGLTIPIATPKSPTDEGYYTQVNRRTKDRAKQCNAEKSWKFLGGTWSIIDNCNKHANGRIWVLWDRSRVEVRGINMTDQLIHCGVYSVDGSFINWLTTIYASNKLEKRRII